MEVLVTVRLRGCMGLWAHQLSVPRQLIREDLVPGDADGQLSLQLSASALQLGHAGVDSSHLRLHTAAEVSSLFQFFWYTRSQHISSSLTYQGHKPM